MIADNARGVAYLAFVGTSYAQSSLNGRAEGINKIWGQSH